MDMTVFFVRDLHEPLKELGSVPWFHSRPGAADAQGRSTTEMHIDWAALRAFAARGPAHGRLVTLLKTVADLGAALGLSFFEAGSRMLADGPKVFEAEDEQWESMEQVSIGLEPHEFRAPFPSFAVAVPAGARARWSAKINLPSGHLPRYVMVRWRSVGERGVTEPNLHVIVPFRGLGLEEHYLFSPHHDGSTIEDALRNRISDDESDLEVATLNRGPVVFTPETLRGVRDVARAYSRAAINLTLMLVHFGSRVAGPADPGAWAKHRRKPSLAHLALGDMERIELLRPIVLRKTLRTPFPQDQAPEEGPARTVACHWRRGHWRALPGYGQARALGASVPLLFIQPVLVNAGEGAEASQARTYHLKG